MMTPMDPYSHLISLTERLFVQLCRALSMEEEWEEQLVGLLARSA